MRSYGRAYGLGMFVFFVFVWCACFGCSVSINNRKPLDVWVGDNVYYIMCVISDIVIWLSALAVDGKLTNRVLLFFCLLTLRYDAAPWRRQMDVLYHTGVGYSRGEVCADLPRARVGYQLGNVLPGWQGAIFFFFFQRHEASSHIYDGAHALRAVPGCLVASGSPWRCVAVV